MIDGPTMGGCDVDAHYTGMVGARWYHFTGEGGDALPLSLLGTNHCGTKIPDRLSGSMPQEDATPGRYTSIEEGLVTITVHDGTPD